MFFKNLYKKFGISYFKVKKFESQNSFIITDVRFKNYNLKISNPHWFLHSIKELYIDEVYKFKCDSENPVIIDCGANWGLSVLYFKELYPSANIFAFEADPNIFNLLKMNIQSCNLYNVELINKAVWIDDSFLHFSTDGGLGGSITNLGIKKTNGKNIEALRLKNFLTLFQKIDFLKIDIEGAEYDVIKDCSDVLANVSSLFIEYHSSPNSSQTLDEILSIVKKAGFRYYIKEAFNNMQYPFISKKDLYYDLQLNIFCFRI